MREYRFRGKRVDNKEWVEGDLIMVYNHDTSMPNEWTPAIKPLGKGLVEVIPETVGQFTGLNDTKEVGIFEGDTIRGKSNNPYTAGHSESGKVVWKKDRWHIEGTVDSLQEFFKWHDNVEVVKYGAGCKSERSEYLKWM